MNGATAFWPRSVYFAELADDTKIAGHIISKEKNARVGEVQRWFVGLNSLSGQRFRFIPLEQIRTLRKAEEYYVFEPVSGGRIFCLPVSLIDNDGARLEGASLNHDVIVRTWKKSRKLIMEDGFRDQVPAAQSQVTPKHQSSHDQLTRSNHGRLLYRLADGREGHILLSEVVDLTRPGTMSPLQKIIVYVQRWIRFLTGEPRVANTEGGIFPAIFGTLVMTVLMSAAVVPFGVMAAVFLREYARPGLLLSAVRISVNNLAGVPSIVYGVFGLGFFVYLIGGSIDDLLFAHRKPTPVFGTGGILWASLTLALLTLPVVIVASEEALGAVSYSTREASLACGATKWQTIWRVVLPAALPGILTGMILAMARGAGEVAPLMITGVVKLAAELPVDLNPPFVHLERKFMHLGFHIYDLGFQSPDAEATKPLAFATTLVLIALVGFLNITAVLLREKLRSRFRVSSL